MSLWTLRIIRFVTWRGSDHSANTRARPDIPKAKLDIVGPDEAERRARRLLQILGLPQLPIGPFIEALSIDNAKNNSVLALCGDLVHKMLLTDAAREASSRFTADMIEKAILALVASTTSRAHAALAHHICPNNNQQKRLQAIHLDQFVFHLSRDQRRGIYSAEWNRLGNTVEAVLGATYLASGPQWRYNCLEVMKKLGLDAPSAWERLWNDRQIPFRMMYGEQVWSEIEAIGKGIFFR